MKASCEGHASVVTLLMNYKADVNLVDHVRETMSRPLNINLLSFLHLRIVITTIIQRSSRLEL